MSITTPAKQKPTHLLWRGDKRFKLAHKFLDIEKCFMCYKCKKPVQQIQIQFGSNSNVYRFIALCHGEKDICELDIELMAILSKDSAAGFKEIVCFKPVSEQALLETPPEFPHYSKPHEREGDI